MKPFALYSLYVWNAILNTPFVSSQSISSSPMASLARYTSEGSDAICSRTGHYSSAIQLCSHPVCCGTQCWPDGDRCCYNSGSSQPSCSHSNSGFGTTAPSSPAHASAPITSDPQHTTSSSISLTNSSISLTTPPISTNSQPPLLTSPTSSFASVSTSSQSFPSAPAASGTAANITIGASDPRVSYTQGDWANSSACSGRSRSATQAGSSLVFQFFGSAVYMRTKLGANGNGGRVNVTLDGSGSGSSGDGGVDVSGESGDAGALDCVIVWSASGLDNGPHTVEIALIGASAGTPANTTQNSQSEESATFVLNEFLITQANSTTEVSNSTSGSATSTASLQPSSPVSASSATAGIAQVSSRVAILILYLYVLALCV